ncbi:hypothetical protein [Alloscardovia omnicolens]|uniref:hypothetical protein n=1 Tax=Alloscardovia omnicolens TaxID=419015 RepID=UPI003C6F63CD
MYANNYNQPQQPQQPQQSAQPVKLASLGQLMNGGGAKSFFTGDSQPGEMVEGEIVSIEVTQVNVFGKKQPDYWQNGDPKQQIHIVLQTQLPPVDSDDDGRRSLWVKGWGAHLKALRDAAKKAGVDEPHIGDRMRAKFMGFGERGKASQLPKVYEYTIIPASQAAVSNLMGGGASSTPAPVATPTPAPVAPATPAAPVPAAAIPTTAVSQPNVNDIKALLNIGKSEEEIAALMNTSVAVVHALAGAPQTPAVEQDSIAF